MNKCQFFYIIHHKNLYFIKLNSIKLKPYKNVRKKLNLVPSLLKSHPYLPSLRVHFPKHPSFHLSYTQPLYFSLWKVLSPFSLKMKNIEAKSAGEILSFDYSWVYMHFYTLVSDYHWGKTQRDDERNWVSRETKSLFSLSFFSL